MAETYRAVKNETGSAADACTALITQYGITAAQAADLCWRIETGKPMPAWASAKPGDAVDTRAVAAYHRAAERSQIDHE